MATEKLVVEKKRNKKETQTRHLRACVPDHERHGCCGAELPPADRCNLRGKVPLLTVTGWLGTVRDGGSRPLRQPEVHTYGPQRGMPTPCQAMAAAQFAAPWPAFTQRPV